MILKEGWHELTSSSSFTNLLESAKDTSQNECFGGTSTSRTTSDWSASSSKLPFHYIPSFTTDGGNRPLQLHEEEIPKIPSVDDVGWATLGIPEIESSTVDSMLTSYGLNPHASGKIIGSTIAIEQCLNELDFSFKAFENTSCGYLDPSAPCVTPLQLPFDLFFEPVAGVKDWQAEKRSEVKIERAKADRVYVGIPGMFSYMVLPFVLIITQSKCL